MRGFSMVVGGALVAASHGVASGAPAVDARLGPMAADLRHRVGSWCVDARLQLTPAAPPARIRAEARSRLIGHRWLVTELKSLDSMGGFEGVGINGYDPQQKKYVGIWIDGSRGFIVPVEGVYDSTQEVFRTTSTERRSDGQTTTVTSETVKRGRDREVTTFTAVDAGGRPYERMVLTYTRAKAAGSCNAV